MTLSSSSSDLLLVSFPTILRSLTPRTVAIFSLPFPSAPWQPAQDFSYKALPPASAARPADAKPTLIISPIKIILSPCRIVVSPLLIVFKVVLAQAAPQHNNALDDYFVGFIV